MTSQNCLRLCMWSGPRNVSTALMYSFAQRSDTRVFDEPLYGYYLETSGAPHPGAEEVIAAMDCDGQRVVREVVLGPCPQPILFFKMMAHHLRGLDWAFLEQTVNILLTRDPRDMLPSLAKNIPHPTLRDTGYDTQVEVLRHTATRGQTTPVIDSRDLLLDPSGVLSELCRQINIPFEERMLRWEAGPRPEDGIWAKYWYASVHQSTGFIKYRPKTDPFPDHLHPLLEECLPYYEELSQQAIRAENGAASF